MTGETRPPGDDGKPQVIVMGVSAVGKSTVAAVLARELGTPFVDADALHPSANVERMARGIPLRDEDRWPWLDLVGEELAGARTTGLVIACSALRRTYRDRIRRRAPEVLFLHLEGSRELLGQRAAERRNHFMPPALLDSQFSILEHLGEDEAGVVLPVDDAVDTIAQNAYEWVKAQQL